jgi:hypothetical protein
MRAARGDAPSLRILSPVTMSEQVATLYDARKPIGADRNGLISETCRGLRSWHAWREAHKNLGDPCCSPEGEAVADIGKAR